MATFRDLPSEIQAIIFKAKDDIVKKERRELWRIANEFWRESGLDIEGDTSELEERYKDNIHMMLLMLKVKLNYYKLKEG